MGLRDGFPFWFPVRKFDDPVGLHKNFRYIEDWFRKVAGDAQRAPTVIIAPDNYTYPEHADIVLTGSGDEVLINAAISDVAGDKGGWIHFMPGTPTIDAKITTVGSPGLLITGSGWDTRFFGNSTVADAVFELGANTTLRNMRIDAQSDFDYAVSSIGDNNRLIQMRIEDAKVADMYVATNSDFGVIDNCELTAGDGIGVHFDGSSNRWRVSNSSISLNSGTGLDMDGNNNFVVNCLILSNGGYGVDIEAGGGAVTACYINNNTSGDVNGSGNVFHNFLGDAYVEGTHTVAHTVASHSDTTATGAETETLTDGSDADSLHDHAVFVKLDGTRAMTGALDVDQPSTTGAAPVITLDQADVDEDFFKFTGTSDTNVDRALVDAANFTTPGAIVLGRPIGGVSIMGIKSSS